MTHIPKNILHDWKTARMERSYLSQVEFLGSSVRTSFLRAWLVTAVKVLFIFALMNFHVDLVSKMQENVGLLDKYIHNDFTVYQPPPLRMAARQPGKAILVVSNNLQPRGPSISELADLPTAEVAGDSTSEPTPETSLLPAPQ